LSRFHFSGDVKTREGIFRALRDRVSSTSQDSKTLVICESAAEVASVALYLKRIAHDRTVLEWTEDNDVGKRCVKSATLGLADFLVVLSVRLVSFVVDGSRWRTRALGLLRLGLRRCIQGLGDWLCVPLERAGND
jgi:hypothetical protein